MTEDASRDRHSRPIELLNSFLCKIHLIERALGLCSRYAKCACENRVYCIQISCIQDTLSSRAALGLPAECVPTFRPSASREQRYLAYKQISEASSRSKYSILGQDSGILTKNPGIPENRGEIEIPKSWEFPEKQMALNFLYTRYPIVARALGRVRRVSKGILHTTQL